MSLSSSVGSNRLQQVPGVAHNNRYERSGGNNKSRMVNSKQSDEFRAGDKRREATSTIGMGLNVFKKNNNNNVDNNYPEKFSRQFTNLSNLSPFVTPARDRDNFDAKSDYKDSSSRNFQNLDSAGRFFNKDSSTSRRNSSNASLAVGYRPNRHRGTTTMTNDQEHNNFSSSKTSAGNFPPLHAPQSIVNVKHPFIMTESKSKSNEQPSIGAINKDTAYVNSSLQVKDTDSCQQQQQFINYNHVSQSLPPPQPPYQESFAAQAPPTLLYSHSPDPTQHYSQYAGNSVYDPNYRAPTLIAPLSQFTAPDPNESLVYQRFDQRVNGYYASQPTEIHNPSTHNHYQYQNSTGQMQDSQMFIQSMHSPMPMPEQQYVANNFTPTVRTEMIPPRMSRHNPRINK